VLKHVICSALEGLLPIRRGGSGGEAPTLRNWLEAHGVTHVAMESTGVYWRPVFYVLENASRVSWPTSPDRPGPRPQDRRPHSAPQVVDPRAHPSARRLWPRDARRPRGRHHRPCGPRRPTSPRRAAQEAPGLAAGSRRRLRPRHAFLVSQLLTRSTTWTRLSTRLAPSSTPPQRPSRRSSPGSTQSTASTSARRRS
jgi:hypothetical protein